MIQWQGFVQPQRQGASHKRQGNSTCQDKAVFKENHELIVAVLSDGLGSLEFSRIAAEAITESISKYLLSYDYNQLREDLFKNDVLDECKKTLNEYSDRLNIDMSKMDCTLLFVVVFKNKPMHILGQLGDGAICVVSEKHASQFYVMDDKHKLSSNFTKTVLSSDAHSYFNLKCYSSSECLGFFVTSDGLENELYSKAGKVKRQIQWYFNLISNNDDSRCINEINTRWDEITSDEAFGFTDDMSLAVIFQPNKSIDLPEEANWLCICGHRNRMESSRCENCGKDLLKLYKGINFMQYGGKLSFFTELNTNPKKEEHVLHQHCAYGVESSPNYVDKQAKIKYHDNPTRQESTGQQVSYGTARNPSTPIEYPQSANDSDKRREVPPRAEAIGQATQKPNEATSKQPSSQIPCVYSNNQLKGKNGSKLNILICLLVVFFLGFAVNATIHMSDKKEANLAVSKLSFLQEENNKLKIDNGVLQNNVDFLNARIAEFQRLENKVIQFPDGYEHYTYNNGHVFVGEMLDTLPNGVGVVYSPDVIMAGTFYNGLKSGKFYVMYKNGEYRIVSYDNDKEITPQSTTTPTLEGTDRSQNTQGQIESGVKTYIAISDVSVRKNADKNSDVVASLKANAVVLFYGFAQNDKDGDEWIKVATSSGLEGWIRRNEVKEP